MSTQSAHLADKLQQGERLLSRQLECTVNSAHSTLQLGRAYFYFPPNSGEVLPATREDCNTYTLCANNENSLLLAGIAVFKLEPINGKCLHEIYAAVAFDTGAEHNEPPQLCARFIVTERGVDFSCSPGRLRRYYERSISHALRPMQSPQLIQGKSFDATFALECWMDRSSSTRPFELRVSLLPSTERSSGNILDMEYLELPYPGGGGEGQPMSVRSSTIDVDAFADEDEYDDDFAYDNRMIDRFSQHMESMHLATGLDSQHAELIREHQNESSTSGSTGTCVSMTIANNHPLVTLTGRHQYTHEGTIEMEPTDSIGHGKTQEYRAINRGAKDTAAVVVYEVKSTHHLASVPSRPYHRLFLAVACRNKIEKQRSASTKYTAESIEERADMANIHEMCVFMFRSDSPNFPEYDLLLKRFYEHYAVHLLAPISDDDTTSWMYLLDNDTSFVVQFSQIQNGNSATTRVSIEETSKEYTDNNNRSVSSFPSQILMLGPVLDIPLSGFSWHCSNAFIEIAKEIEATMSWKPSQAIQLIENATDRLDLTIVPIWSSDHFELLSNDTNSSKPLPQNKYEIRRVDTTNSPGNKCLAIYHLSNVSTTASLMDDPLDGTIMIVHHHNYLTALTVISVNNIQLDQLINHVVPSLENKGIVNYFGSMIPAYRYISLDESTRMCIKAFRAHPESNDKEHITKPAVITVSVIDQLHEEYSKAEVNTSVVNNSIQPLFRIHHGNKHEGFSLELPSEWCIGYTREKSNEESNNTSILLEDADIIQHVRNTSDSMEEGIIAMEYLLLHDDGTSNADNKISLFTRVYSQGSSGTIIDVNMQWQQGKHLVMNDGASISTSYTLDNNVDRHMLVQGYTPSNDCCLLSMYLVEIPSTKSYDILFLATTSLVEIREIMRAALSKIDMVDHLFDEPLYMSIDEDDNTDVEHTTDDDDDDVVSNNTTIDLVNGIIFLEGNGISYADDIDVSSKYLADIPIYNSKQGCVVWEIASNDLSLEKKTKHSLYYLGLFWKYIKASNNQLVKSTIAYVFTSGKTIQSDKAQFSRIMGYMDAVLSHANDNKYTYTLPTGERFGITIEISDDPEATLNVKLYQKNDLIRNDNAYSFSSLDGVVLHIPRCIYNISTKSGSLKIKNKTYAVGLQFSVILEKNDPHKLYNLTEYWVNPDVWNQSTQVQSTVMKNDVNVVFSIPAKSELLHGGHICVVYQIHYIRRPTPTCDVFLVLVLIDGQLGMAVVHNEDTPTRIRVPFINKIASLLSDDNDLYMLTPFTEIDKEFGLNTDRRLHVTGVTTPGNPPIVYISTSLRPVLTPVRQPPTQQLSNQDINVLLYSSLHEFSTQLDCSTSINSSTVIKSKKAYDNIAYYKIAQLVGNAHKSSICMRFSITNESAKHKSQFIELCIQRRIHDKDDAGLLDISCTLSRKIKQVEDSSLARNIPDYIRRLGSATIQLRCNQSLSINSDNYSTTEIYTTESNRLFATVYATYVPGTGISCILALSSMLNKVENDLTSAGKELSLLRYPKVMARYNYGFEDDCIPIRVYIKRPGHPDQPIIVNASKKFDLQLVINVAIHKYKDQGCQPPLKSSSTHYWNVRVHNNGFASAKNIPAIKRMHDCTLFDTDCFVICEATAEEAKQNETARKEYLLHQKMLQSHLANLYTLLDIGSKIVTSYAASMQSQESQSSDDATKRDTKRNMGEISASIWHHSTKDKGSYSQPPQRPAMVTAGAAMPEKLHRRQSRMSSAEPPLRLGISPGAPPMAHSSSSPFDYPHVPPMQHPMVPAMGAPPPPSMQESSHQPPVLGSIGSQLEPHNTPLSSEQASNWSTLADEEMTETLSSSRTRLGKGKAPMTAAEEEQMAAEASTSSRSDGVVNYSIKYINSSWSDVTVILYNKDNEIMEKKETAPIIQDDTAITCSFSTAKDELRRIVTLFGQANKYLLITTFPDGIHSLEDDIISEIIPYTAVARVTRVLPLAKQFNANGDTDRQSILSQIYERKDVPYTCQHALQRDPGQNLVELSYTIRSISMPSWPIEIQGMLGTATTSTNQHGKNTSRSIAIGDSSTSSMGYLTEEAAGTSSSLKKKSSSESLRKRVEKNRKKLIELKDNIKKRFGSESK